MAVLLLLLPSLAALQYHWLGQLSEGNREQMQAGLRSAAVRFSQDFNHEITRVGISLLPQPMIEGGEKFAAIAENYDRWRETASYPGLIKSVFVTRPGDGERLNLALLNPETRLFENRDWPDEMAELRDRLEQHLVMMRRPPEPPEMPPAPERIRRPAPLQFLNGDLPALTMPLVEVQQVQQLPGNRVFRRLLPIGYAIIILDLRCIQQEILPALTQRHFTEGGQLSYELLIANQRDQQRIVYQAGPETAPSSQNWDYAKDDASIGLFGFNFEEMRASFLDKFQKIDPATPATVIERNADQQMPRRSLGRLQFPPGPGGGLRFGEQRDLWELHLRHRTGSLEAAVSRVRWRNLFISSSILVVLAASIALLIISAQRARSLAQQQMDFVAGVSHELRTPIAVIDAAGYNIARGVMKNEEQIKKYGLLIRKETNRLKEIIEQILEFSGVQSGRQKYDLLPTSVPEVIEEVLAASQPLLDEGNFQIDKELAPDLPLVMADSQALSRAVQNLINNAMKYGSESRWIGLRAETVTMNQGPVVRITVSDRGLGIAPEEQAQIFEPFYRGREARAAQIHGSGLGLSLVKNIIEEHGGSVSVQSRPGAGSTFTLNLPAAAPIGDQAISAGPRLQTEKLQPGVEN